MLEGLLRVVVGVIFFTLFGLVLMCWIGLAIGTANAWILEGTFSDGWSAVWDRWVPALGWSVIFLVGASLLSGGAK